MSTYTSTHVPSTPLPTTGWQVGPNIVNRCQDLNGQSTLVQQQTDYYASKLKEIKQGKHAPYVYGTFKEVLADYNNYLKQRIPIQLKARKQAMEEQPNARFITMIPKMYMLRSGIPTEDDQKEFVFLSNNDRPLTKYLKEKGLFFMTQFFGTGGSDIFMLTATLTDDLYEADSEDEEAEDPSDLV